MFKSVKQHLDYWKRRDIDWKVAYFDSFNHPHRDLIIEKLKKMRFGSILELGCAAGANLYRVQKEFPYVKIGGVDINKNALETARSLLDKGSILEWGDAANVFFGDGSVDVVLTDMMIIYGNGKKIIKEIKRISRHQILLVEFHSKSFFKRWGLRLVSGYYAYDYEKLLKRAGFYDIELQRLTEKDWPGGEPQKSFGYLIQAKR